MSDLMTGVESLSGGLTRGQKQTPVKRLSRVELTMLFHILIGVENEERIVSLLFRD